jgi:1,4-alpha-glucan branching enzyme
VAPRLMGGFDGNWGDTAVELPEGRWRNVLTDLPVERGLMSALNRSFSRSVAELERGIIMQTFRVWAPTPKKVELAVHQQRVPMERQAEGIGGQSKCLLWAAGEEYGFVLDGEVHSQIRALRTSRMAWMGFPAQFTHQNFVWADTGWQAPPLSSAVIYELHIGSFTPSGHFRSRN